MNLNGEYPAVMSEDEAFDDLKMHFGRELHNAGKFLFDGCEGFYNLSQKYMDYGLFDILLRLSIGVERVQKIILSLSENKMNEQDKKALYTHSHQRLQAIIKKIYSNDVNFNKEQNKFIELLGDFYKQDRYGFFHEEDKNQKSLFLANDLFREYCHSIGLTWFEDDKKLIQTKEKIEDVISNVITKYIDCLENISKNQSIYVTETQTEFELYIFVFHEDNVFNYFKKLEIARNELLYFLSQKSIEDEVVEDYPPLDFEISDIKDFISCRDFYRVKSDLIDFVFNEYAENYDDKKSLEDRKEFLKYFPEDLEHLYKKIN